MNVINVVKLLNDAVVFKNIKEHILERNPMNAISVVKLLHITVILKVITTHCGEKHFECSQCGKAFLYHSGLQRHKRKHIVQRNPVNVLNFIKPFHITIDFQSKINT